MINVYFRLESSASEDECAKQAFLDVLAQVMVHVEGSPGHHGAGFGRPLASHPVELRAMTQGPVSTKNEPFVAEVADPGDTSSHTTRRARAPVDQGLLGTAKETEWAHQLSVLLT